MNVHDRIAERLRALRDARGWSLETLAEHNGVSRSNISLIERGQSSPTAVVLDKLATALAVPSPRYSAKAARTRPLHRSPAPPIKRYGPTPPRATNAANSRRRCARRSSSSKFTSHPARASTSTPARATPTSTSRSGCSKA